MEQDVASWGAIAIFVGPILAGVALIFLRWQMERGPWWTWPLLVIAGIMGYFGYQHAHAVAPSPPNSHPVHHRLRSP
jgi:4-hydroxybenzoate polyprenyltransferase